MHQWYLMKARKKHQADFEKNVCIHSEIKVSVYARVTTGAVSTAVKGDNWEKCRITICWSRFRQESTFPAGKTGTFFLSGTCNSLKNLVFWAWGNSLKNIYLINVYKCAIFHGISVHDLPISSPRAGFGPWCISWCRYLGAHSRSLCAWQLPVSTAVGVCCTWVMSTSSVLVRQNSSLAGLIDIFWFSLVTIDWLVE